MCCLMYNISIIYCSGDYRDARARIGRELCHILLVRGDYNTEALIFKWPLRDFLMFLKKKTSKMKENAVALIIT